MKLIISDSTSTVSLSSHPDYRSYNPRFMYDNTGMICMTSYEYIWLSLWYHTTLWHHTLHSCHHTQDTCHRIHCSWTFTYSLLIIPQLLYVWHESHCIYDIIWILLTSQPLFMTSQDCIHDITSTLFMTSHSQYMTLHTICLCHHSHSNYNNTRTIFLTLYSVYMTPQMLNEWQHSDSIWYDTQCISVIKPTWLMTSHTMYEWNHTHCMYDTRGTLYDLTSTLAENRPLFLCHGTHSVYDIICIIYDVTHTMCMTTQALYLTWNPLKLPSHPLYMSSHPLCQRHHTYCVRHHRWHIYAIICVVHGIIFTLYDNNLYYLWHHMTYIHYIWNIMYDISFTLYDVTFTMCITSENDSIYDIKPYIFMTYSLYMASHTKLPHSHCVRSQPLCLTLHSMYFWHYTQCTNVMKRSICMSSQPLYVWHHMHYIWHHIHSLWYHTMLWHSHTLYSCLHTQDTCHRIHCCWALTYSVLNIAYLQYVFSQTDYMYDIIWILCDITTALYDITILYSWHHFHTIHDITPTVYNMTYTLLVISQPLLLWQDTYYVFDIILSVYDISHGEWMTTQWLYLTWKPMYLFNQTHLIDDVTPYGCMKSYTLHAWHHRHFMWHHIHSCWQHTIVCMSWHTLCLWNHMHYICCHPFCVHDYPSSIAGLKPVKTAISSTLYVITHS